MKRSLITWIACFSLALLACEQKQQEVIELIASPTATNSSLPRLVTAPDGAVYLSWVEKEEDKTARLKYSRLNGNEWSTPVQIAEGKNWFVNWADFPALMVNGTQMSAHWLQKSDLGTYDYDVRLSQSNDGGKSWGNSFVVHNDGVAAEHGFVSMLPMAEGKTFITWLDGRNTKGGGHATGEHGGNGAMTLRAAIFDQEGQAINRWELDDRICDCCQTGAAMTSQGPVVVYRDRSEKEIRDMSIVRYVDGEWTQPMPLAIELWEINGCPVNGPAIAAKEETVAAAWFTAKGNTPTVKLAFSSDAGASFGEPIIVSEGITNGRVGVTLLENGTAVISWMENRDDHAQVMVALYKTTGELLKKVQVGETSAARASGFPVITSTGNQVYAVWTETGESSIVKTAKINL